MRSSASHLDSAYSWPTFGRASCTLGLNQGLPSCQQLTSPGPEAVPWRQQIILSSLALCLRGLWVNRGFLHGQMNLQLSHSWLCAPACSPGLDAAASARRTLAEQPMPGVNKNGGVPSTVAKVLQAEGCVFSARTVLCGRWQHQRTTGFATPSNPMEKLITSQALLRCWG
jgi:hypothetical protein